MQQRQKPKKLSSKSQTKSLVRMGNKTHMVLSERMVAVSVSFEPMILTLFKAIYNQKFCSTPNSRIIKLILSLCRI